MNGFGDRELIWWARGQWEVGKIFATEYWSTRWRRPWRSLLAYFRFASKAETRGRNLKGRNLSLREAWLGTMMCFYKVMKWAGWAGYWTCLDSWPHVIRTGQELAIPPTLGTSADWAYLCRHCKNFWGCFKAHQIHYCEKLF